MEEVFEATIELFLSKAPEAGREIVKAATPIIAKETTKKVAKNVALHTAAKILAPISPILSAFSIYRSIASLMKDNQKEFGTDKYRMESNGVWLNMEEKESIWIKNKDFEYIRLYSMFKCFDEEDIKNAFMLSILYLNDNVTKYDISNAKNNNKYISAHVKISEISSYLLIIWNDGYYGRYNGCYEKYFEEPELVRKENNPKYEESMIGCNRFDFAQWRNAFSLCASPLDYILLMDGIVYCLSNKE